MRRIVHATKCPVTDITPSLQDLLCRVHIVPEVLLCSCQTPIIPQSLPHETNHKTVRTTVQ